MFVLDFEGVIQMTIDSALSNCFSSVSEVKMIEEMLGFYIGRKSYFFRK